MSSSLFLDVITLLSVVLLSIVIVRRARFEQLEDSVTAHALLAFLGFRVILSLV